MMLDDEGLIPLIFNYRPSDKTHEQLYNLVRSACDGLSVQITNVVEHPENFSTVFYMKTSGTFSSIKIYVNSKGFVTYAKPMSMLGTDDGELRAVINEMNKRLI